jgi:hypothetical protein
MIEKVRVTAMMFVLAILLCGRDGAPLAGKMLRRKVQGFMPAFQAA